jgi:hypothetical protein
LQQLRHIELEHLQQDVEEGQHAEHAHLAPEHGRVLVLQPVVEAPVPLVEEHQCIDIGQVERDDRGEHGPRAPFLLGPEIRRRERKDALQNLGERGGSRRDG